MPTKIEPKARLTLVDFSDRDLLGLLIDALDPDGWASSEAISNLPGLKFLREGHPRPVQCVGSRLGWLWRYGAIEREQMRDEHGTKVYIAGDKSRPKLTQRWRLTPLGEAMVKGSLTKAQQAQLEGMGMDKMLSVTRWLGRSAIHAPDLARTLTIREFRYSTSDRRNGHAAVKPKRAIG